MIEDHDLTATVVNVLTVTNLTKLADQNLLEYQRPVSKKRSESSDLMVVVGRLNLSHLLGVILAEGIQSSGVENRVVRKEGTDV